MTLAERNRRARAAYLRRLADYLLCGEFDDVRDQDLKDRGVILKWRQRVARRALPPPSHLDWLEQPIPMFLRPQAE